MLEKPIKSINYAYAPSGDLELRITIDKCDISEILSSEKPLVVKIEPVKEPRSHEANAYMWVLCTKIAKAVNSTKNEIYKQALYEVGVFSDMPILTKAVDESIQRWSKIGLGWFAEAVRESKLTDYTVVRYYYGSHVYSTSEMAVLIDYVVEAAKGAGIDTRTPEEIEKMKNLWGEED